MDLCPSESEECEDGVGPSTTLMYYMEFIFILMFMFILIFYYESRKREVKTRLLYENRCDERLKN
jgi:hypothetical protein